jgi:RND family efflux transporter MFP subunit
MAVAIWALGAAVVLSGACAPADGVEAQDQADSTAGARVVNVRVTPVEPSNFVDYIRITGQIEALHDVTVSAQEAGVIAEFFAEKGGSLNAGQPVAKIDDRLLVAQVDEARALSELADEQFERQRRLWEGERIGSEIAYLQAKSAAVAAAARLASLEERLARTVIRAPVDGVFDEKFVEAGEMVSPGTPVARFLSIRQVKVTGGVPERFAPSVRRGEIARVHLDVMQGREFTGRITFVGSSVDQRSRTVPIEILLSNPGVLKPHMVANVQVPRARLENVIVVPQEAVIRTEDGYQVFVAAESSGRLIAEARPVRLGPSYENRVVVDSGLAVGDALITLGHRQVERGSRIRVVPGGADR